MKCPCACGRRINRTDAKLARRALFVRSLCDGLGRSRQVGVENDAPPEDLIEIDAMIRRGEYFDRAFLLLAHGATVTTSYIELRYVKGDATLREPVFGVNDPDDWEERALGVISMSMGVDREAFATWVPYQKV